MSGRETEVILAASAVVIGKRALAIEGVPGSGKSSLALALIDRGAMLIGDDGIRLALDGNGDALIASPPPNIEGLLELRGIGLFEFPLAEPAPLALILSLGAKSERMPQTASHRMILGAKVPTLPFEPGALAPAVRAEMALSRFGSRYSSVSV